MKNQKEKIKEIIIASNATLLEGLKKMDSVRRKLLLVNEGDKYIGLLSIGDIQRAIINSTNLNSVVSTIIRKDNIIAKPETSIDEIKKQMLSIRAEFMPVVSSEDELINVYFWEDLFGEKQIAPNSKFNVPVVIMAGGMGTRLRPLTNVLPKPLIPIGEKTIIEEIIDRFTKHGCDNFYLSVNYKSDLIEYYINNLNLPSKIHFYKDGPPLGTAGSLSLLKGQVVDTFFVSNCDILLDQDYSEILKYHKENKNEITLVAALKHYSIPYGTVETSENGLLIELTEKPEITFKINSGMYILEPHLLKEIPENVFFHITNLIESISERKGKVGVFPVSEGSWKDIGEWDEYLRIMKRS